MTLRAKEVLDDCRVALGMLEDEKQCQRWRVLWAGALALARAVGHVLDKVDGQNKLVKEVARKYFKRWRSEHEHQIFTEFIENERNSVLKEYRSAIHPLAAVPVLLRMSLQSVSDGTEELTSDIYQLDENLYRPMLEGPWEGIDGRDVLQEAINWWSSQLDLIENEVARLRSERE